MKELFDVHCHMVPGVDDGAADLEESLAMLKMQHEDGVRKIIITPHYRRRMFETPAKKVHEQFLKLQEAAKKEYPDMAVAAGTVLKPEQVKAVKETGADLCVTPGLNDATVHTCQEEEIPVLPGCVTATEIEHGLSLGLTTFKFFPAELIKRRFGGDAV